MKLEQIFTNKNEPEDSPFCSSLPGICTNGIFYIGNDRPLPPLLTPRYRCDHRVHLVPDPGTGLLRYMPVLHNFPCKVSSLHPSLNPKPSRGCKGSINGHQVEMSHQVHNTSQYTSKGTTSLTSAFFDQRTCEHAGQLVETYLCFCWLQKEFSLSNCAFQKS